MEIYIKQGQTEHMLQLFGIYIPLAHLYIYIIHIHIQIYIHIYPSVERERERERWRGKGGGRGGEEKGGGQDRFTKQPILQAKQHFAQQTTACIVRS